MTPTKPTNPRAQAFIRSAQAHTQQPFSVLDDRLFTNLPTPTGYEEALLHSIWKWEYLYHSVKDLPAGCGTIRDGGITTCGLCIFNAKLAGNQLRPLCSVPEPCPVFLTTGFSGCACTPYDRYMYAGVLEPATAWAELSFLRQIFLDQYGYAAPSLEEAFPMK